MKVVAAILFILFLLMLGPALMLWGVNTLIIQSGMTSLAAGTSAFFNPIPFNIWTWLACVLLGGFSIFGSVRK